MSDARLRVLRRRDLACRASCPEEEDKEAREDHARAWLRTQAYGLVIGVWTKRTSGKVSKIHGVRDCKASQSVLHTACGTIYSARFFPKVVVEVMPRARLRERHCRNCRQVPDLHELGGETFLRLVWHGALAVPGDQGNVAQAQRLLWKDA